MHASTANEFAYGAEHPLDRKSTRLNSSHSQISYAVFCLKKKKNDSHPSSRAAPHGSGLTHTDEHSSRHGDQNVHFPAQAALPCLLCTACNSSPLHDTPTD